jgi:hypothetical protein
MIHWNVPIGTLVLGSLARAKSHNVPIGTLCKRFIGALAVRAYSINNYHFRGDIGYLRVALIGYAAFCWHYFPTITILVPLTATR